MNNVCKFLFKRELPAALVVKLKVIDLKMFQPFFLLYIVLSIL